MVSLAFLLGSMQGFGLVAAGMMLTTLQIFVFSKLAITDMTLAFFISAAICFFYLGHRERQEIQQKFALKEKQSSTWFIWSFVMMAFGMLCKGPVAVLLPLIIIFIFLVIEKDLFDFIQDTWMELCIGLVLFLAISLPWYLAVHLATHGKFTYEFFMGHNLSRYLTVHTNHLGVFWYYIPVVIVGLFPWSFFLIQALFSNDHSTKFNLRAESAKAAHLMSFCSLWSIVTLVFFSFSQTKLPTYITPIYLPLVIIVAKWWSEKFKTTRSNGYKNIDGLIGLAAMVLVMFIAAILGLIVFKKKLLEIGSSAVFAAIAIICFLLIAAALVSMTAMFSKARVAFCIIVGSSLVSYLISTHFILRPFAIHRDAGARAFSLSLKPGDKLAVYNTHGTVFSFYAHRPAPELSNEELVKYLTNLPENETRYFIAKSRHIAQFDKYLSKQVNGDTAYEIIKTNKIYTYGKSLSEKLPDARHAKSEKAEFTRRK
jgi:4-amino-4-deoxy-L-arabinose transferase-like glycosyltransferase